jgi:hypothetical protein
MTLAIKIGDSVVLDGAKYRMLHRSLSGELCFQDCENGNVRQISEDTLLEKYMFGQAALWVRTDPQIKGWEEKNLRLDFGSLPPEQQREARRCKAYVDAIMEAGRPIRRAETWPTLIDVTARALADPKKPSWQTVSRWLRRYLANRCDIRSLLSGNAANLFTKQSPAGEPLDDLGSADRGVGCDAVTTRHEGPPHNVYGLVNFGWGD